MRKLGANAFMKGKIRFSRNKMMATIVLLMSTSICFSTGFASWYSVGGDTDRIVGAVDADPFSLEPYHVTLVTMTAPSFTTKAGYGFFDETSGEYISTQDLEFTCYFAQQIALKYSLIESHVESGKLSLEIKLSIPNIGTTKQKTCGTCNKTA